MTAWLTRHLQTLIGSLGRLSQHKLATSLTVLVIGVALALPACLHLLVANAQVASGGWNRAVDLSVFLKQGASEAEAKRVADRVRQRRDVAEVQMILADDALKDFRRDSGFGEAIDALRGNPLPHTLIVRPGDQYVQAAALESLATYIRGLPEVDVVQLDTAWVNKLNAILDAIRRGLILAAVVLALGVMVIVGNTIRLDIQNRRDEIEVTKLVGGSDAFVRRPFLYNGIWYGIGGGCVAWVISFAAVAALQQPISRLAGLYGSDFRLLPLGLEPSALLLASGAFLGWLGSYLAATRHLRDIEPT